MWRDVPDQNDRFPGDFMASLRAGSVAALLCGGLTWWLARVYLRTSDPGHTDMAGTAIVVGALDGVMLGIATFVVTYVLRVWRYERQLRRRSDETLRRALSEISAGDRGSHPDMQ